MSFSTDFRVSANPWSLLSHSESSTFALGNRFTSMIGNQEFHIDTMLTGNTLILSSHFLWKIESIFL